MRRTPRLLLLIFLATGCHSAQPAGSLSAPVSTVTSAPEPQPSSAQPTSSSPAPPPVSLPTGVPASYPKDSEPGDVPLAALVPLKASLTGSWFPRSAPEGSDRILVAYSKGPDPFRRTNGLVEWVRFTTKPFWRATYGVSYPPSAGVLGTAVQLGDATADGSVDALVLASTGGSGGCGIWSVVDLAASAQVFQRSLCDSTITFSTKPAGLALTQAIFKPTDPHCCPSSTRISVLRWNGATWSVASQETVSATPS